MLNQRSIESVYTLAQKAAAVGVAITPKTATPLELAVNACYTPQMENSGAPSDTDSFWAANMLSTGSTNKSLAGNYPHDDAIETLSAMGSAAVQRLLNLARNDVRARIDHVMSDVEVIVAESEKVLLSPVAIVSNMMGGIWSVSTLRTLLENYASTPAESVMPPSFFSDRSDAEVVELLKTKTARLDDAIEEWAGVLGAEFFGRIYRDLFVRSTVKGPALDWALDIGGAATPETGRNTALAIFLLAMSLKGQPESESAVSLDDFNRAMYKVIEQTGRTLYRELEKYNTDAKSNTLLRYWPSTNGTLKEGTIISVNGEVYNRWLKEGGTPEILLGSYVSDRVTGYSALLANGERYIKEWTRVLTIRRNQVNTARFNSVISALAVSIAEEIAEMKQEDMVVTGYQVLHTRLNDELMKVGIADITPENLYGTVRHLICHTFYAHTQAESILRSIDLIMQAQPNLDAREAALYAVIDIVGDWVFDLMNSSRMTARSTEIDGRAFLGTINTLANGVELACNIVDRCAGNDISNHIDGEAITVQSLADTFAVKFQAKLQSSFTLG